MYVNNITELVDWPNGISTDCLSFKKHKVSGVVFMLLTQGRLGLEFFCQTLYRVVGK